MRRRFCSVSVFAVAPLQDFLGLDNAARMNYPGSLGGNWTWRMSPEDMNEFLRSRMYETNLLYGRLAASEPDAEE